MIRNFKTVVVEERLVVVHDLGRLGEGERVHFGRVAELLTLGVVTGDEIVYLSLCETDRLVVDVFVEVNDFLAAEVSCNVVRIAVRASRLFASLQLGDDLVANVVVTADRLLVDRDVRVYLVEFGDVLYENVAEVFTHRVIESDGNVTGGNAMGRFASLAAGVVRIVTAVVVIAGGKESADEHADEKHQSNKFFH